MTERKEKTDSVIAAQKAKEDDEAAAKMRVQREWSERSEDAEQRTRNKETIASSKAMEERERLANEQKAREEEVVRYMITHQSTRGARQ